MGQPVEFELADPVDHLVVAGTAAAPERLDARQKLGEGERLGEIVVAARPQALHAVVDLAERGEDQRGGLVAAAAHVLDDRKAIPEGQHAIDDDDVVAAGLDGGGADLAVCGMLGNVPGFTQAAHQECRRILVVFDEEYPHGRHHTACALDGNCLAQGKHAQSKAIGIESRVD